jgi:hypothetical protein
MPDPISHRLTDLVFRLERVADAVPDADPAAVAWTVRQLRRRMLGGRTAEEALAETELAAEGRAPALRADARLVLLAARGALRRREFVPFAAGAVAAEA